MSNTDTNTVTVESALAFTEEQIDNVNRVMRKIAEADDGSSEDLVLIATLMGASAAYMHVHAMLSGEPVGNTDAFDADRLVSAHMARTDPE